MREPVLVGHWLEKDGKIVADDTEQKIWSLIHNRLVRRGDRGGGWIVLYSDPNDDSYCELSFPQGEMQGGGPAKLERLSDDDVRRLYPDLAASEY